MNYFKLIFQLSVVFPILYWTNAEIPILILSITIDSVFSAINFIKLFILDDLSPEDLLLNLNKLYKVGVIDRYIYYISLQVIYLIISYLTWNMSLTILYWSLVVTTCPYIFNLICKKYLSETIKYVEIEKKRFFKIIICKQVAIVINTLSYICIDKDPRISFSELLYLLDDYDNIVNNFITFLKNFFIVSVIHYARKKSSSIYSKMISYFYTYQTGNILESIDYSTAKRRFTDVIVNKKWSKLLDDDILQSIIYMYSLQEDSQMNFGIYLIRFNYMLIKMFTIWTIGAFFENIIIVPILSLFFTIYKKPIKLYFEREQIYKYLFKGIALLVGLLTRNYFLISLICEFGYILTINKVMSTVAQYLSDRFIRLYNILTHYNNYNLFLVCVFLYIEVLKFVKNYINLSIHHYIINYIFLIVITNDFYKKIIYNSIIFLGFLSEYNELHLLYILGLSYLYLNIYHYYNNNKNISISIIAKKMHPSAIESYYNKLKPIENISDNESDSDIEELIDSALTPNAPVIIDNKFDECINVKMYCDNINIIENYIENNVENKKNL